VIDHTYRGNSQPHSHYVAFSRVTKLEGLHILNMHKKQTVIDGKIVCHDTTSDDGKFIKVDRKVQEEMARLRSEGNKMPLCYTPLYTHCSGLTVTFHNVRSLHAHFADLSSDPNLTSARVLCCAETRLTSADPDSLYRLPEHLLLRFDQSICHSQGRPPHGLVVYVKKDMEVMESANRSTNSYE